MRKCRKPKRRIIPAFAGNTKLQKNSGYPCWDHPRIRGEHYWSSNYKLKTLGSSPHSRGTLCSSPLLTPSDRIIPAFAGNTRARQQTPARLRDHPRIRGEHSHRAISRMLGGGSSPHSRGTPIVGNIPEEKDGIIPAFAGNTLILRIFQLQDRDHPRIRGEHTKKSP